MNPWILVLLLASTGAGTDRTLNVTLVEQPVVRHVMLHTQTSYWGNDVEVAQKVHVVDDDSKPVAGATVTLLAPRTRDGVIARVRAYGVTDTSGRATVRAVFEVASSDMVVSLQACVLKTDYCSPLASADLRPRFTLDVTGLYASVATVGDQGFTLDGVNRTFSTVESNHIFGAKSRLEYSAIDTGRNWRRFSISLYGETGVRFARSEEVSSVQGPLFVQKSDSFQPGNTAAGVSGFLSRVALDASVSRTATLQFTVQGFQPLSDRVTVFGGFTGTNPRNSPQETFGKSRGPLAGVAFLGGSGRYRVSVVGAWLKSDASTFLTSSARKVQLPAREAASVDVSWDYHRGGPIHLKLFASGSDLGGAGLTNISTGLQVTIRNPISKLR